MWCHLNCIYFPSDLIYRLLHGWKQVKEVNLDAPKRTDRVLGATKKNGDQAKLTMKKVILSHLSYHPLCSWTCIKKRWMRTSSVAASSAEIASAAQ